MPDQIPVPTIINYSFLIINYTKSVQKSHTMIKWKYESNHKNYPLVTSFTT